MIGMLLLLMAWIALPPPSWVALIRHVSAASGEAAELAEQTVRRHGIDKAECRPASLAIMDAAARPAAPTYSTLRAGSPPRPPQPCNARVRVSSSS